MKARIFVPLGLALLAASAQAVVIDNFSLSAPRLTQTGVGSTSSSQTPFTSSFDTRTLGVAVDTTTDSTARATAKLGSGLGSFSTDAEVNGHFSLTYTSTTGVDLSATQALLVRYAFNDQSCSLVATIESNKPGVGLKTSTELRTMLASSSPYYTKFEFFTPDIDWDAVTKVSFAFDPSRAGDFQLTSVETALPVPEPSTLALTALAAATLARRKPRRNPRA